MPRRTARGNHPPLRGTSAASLDDRSAVAAEDMNSARSPDDHAQHADAKSAQRQGLLRAPPKFLPEREQEYMQAEYTPGMLLGFLRVIVPFVVLLLLGTATAEYGKMPEDCWEDPSGGRGVVGTPNFDRGHISQSDMVTAGGAGRDHHARTKVLAAARVVRRIVGACRVCHRPGRRGVSRQRARDAAMESR